MNLEQVKSVSVAAVGDIMLGEHPVMVGRGFLRAFENGGKQFPFTHVTKLLQEADLTFGNLECALTKSFPGTSRLARSCVGFASAAERLRVSGFDVLSLANNHTQQHGEDCFAETVEQLDAAGLRTVGLADNDFHNCRPVDVDVQGVPFRILGYSLRPRQYFTDAPLYAEPKPESLLADIAAGVDARRTVLVSIHWGDELSLRPRQDQVVLGRRMIAAGASLVLGHHPHVLQGVERYKHGLIAYSLGNFVFDIDWNEPVRQSLILRCRICDGQVTEYDWIPLRIGTDFQPAHASPQTAQLIDLFMKESTAQLEGVSLSDLEERLNHDYQRDLRRALRHYRVAKYSYVLWNWWRYQPAVFSSILGDFFRSKLPNRS